MTGMGQPLIFLCGFAGSAAVEVVMLHQLMQDGAELPERYHKPAFWVVRILLAVVGGGLALAYDIDKPLLAANIGAATPLIIKAFAEGVRPIGHSTVKEDATEPIVTQVKRKNQ